MCAQKVFLEFVDNDGLDQESMSKLLGSPHAVRPILTFLKNVCLLEKQFWDRNCIGYHSSVPQAFLSLLQDGFCLESRSQAAWVIADLCWAHQENSNAFANTASMLSQLALHLSQDYKCDLQESAAKILAAYAYWDYYCDGSVVPKIVAERGLVDSLMELLAREQNPSVQNSVGHALSNLTTAMPIVKKTSMSEHGALDPGLCQGRAVVSGNHRDVLAQWPGLLEVLANLLAKSENPVLQAYTSSSLANMAGTNESATLQTLLHHDGLVDKLVGLLKNPENPQLETQSARAICNLAKYRTGSPIREEILHWPGLVDGLAKSLLKSENPSLQLNAVRAFSHLAFRIERDSAYGVLNHPGVVENLVQLLDAGFIPAAASAVSTLCSFTDIGDDRLRAMIVSFPTLLPTLTKSVLTGNNQNFKADGVCLIANLAVTNNPAILRTLAESPGLVEKLAELLAEDQFSMLQACSVRALLNLAGEENNDNFDISDFAQLLQRLENALLQSEQMVVRETIVRALTCLLASKENINAGMDAGLDSAETCTLLDKFAKKLSQTACTPPSSPRAAFGDLSPDLNITLTP